MMQYVSLTSLEQPQMGARTGLGIERIRKEGHGLLLAICSNFGVTPVASVRTFRNLIDYLNTKDGPTRVQEN
jgi:hypothetical protein